MPTENSRQLDALPQPGPPRSGAAGKAVSPWLNDVLWVPLSGVAVFLVFALAAWWRYRRRKRASHHAHSPRRRSRRSVSGRRIPTLAEVGGLPPLRSDGPQSSRPDAGQ